MPCPCARVGCSECMLVLHRLVFMHRLWVHGIVLRVLATIAKFRAPTESLPPRKNAFEGGNCELDRPICLRRAVGNGIASTPDTEMVALAKASKISRLAKAFSAVLRVKPGYKHSRMK